MTIEEHRTKEQLRKAASPDTTGHVADVIDKEREHLGLGNQKDIYGLAISGGGIRSASFGLGVMQALVAKNQLEKMDYMSTVSGGGYIGSALTWALRQGGKEAGTRSDNFPLGKKGSSARQDDTRENNQPGLQNNGLLDYIRQHSSYLIPTGSLGIVSLTGVLVRSILLSLMVYFGFMVIVLTLFKQCNFFDTDLAVNLLQHNSIMPSFSLTGIFIPLSILLMAVFLVQSLAYSLFTFTHKESGILREYLRFIRGQQVIGWLWKISAACLVIGLLPVIVGYRIKTGAMSAAGGSSAYGILIGIWQYIKAQKNEKSNGFFSAALVYLAAFGLIYGMLVFAYAFSMLFFDNGTGNIHWLWFIIFTIVISAFGFFVNLNLVGPHRIWRDRLMEAFMPDADAVRANKWKPAKKADSALMEHMCDVHNPRPYHIINTNLILNNSEQVKFNGRGGDNFILSPLYCGSEATGWRTTRSFQKKEGRGITLATAMATSAAALNPDAGVSGGGVTRNAVVSTLLSLLNLRLGYWTGNPGKDVWPFPPNFFTPGFTDELLRDGFTEKDTRILLSDGGHFENLAIYELIRRKLDLIVLSDGGADPGFNFDDLANAVEKVRVDFGAKIVFRDDDIIKGKDNYGPNGILFDATGRNAFQKKYEIAQRGYAIADIYYNDNSRGILVYLKLAMIDGLPTDVYSYKGLFPAFPHESTADQFFDEKQFEAYRELGYNVTRRMMESEEGKKLFSITD